MTDNQEASDAVSRSPKTTIVVHMHADDATRFLDAFRKGKLDKFNVTNVEVEPQKSALPNRWADTVEDHPKQRGGPERG
jgi:hypothetical protein